MFPVRYTTPNLTSLSKQGEGEPHGVQGGEHWGQPGLLDLPASGNAVNIVFRKRSTGVPISSILFKRIYFMGTHFISVSNDIMSRRISIGQVLQQHRTSSPAASGSQWYAHQIQPLPRGWETAEAQEHVDSGLPTAALPAAARPGLLQPPRGQARQPSGLKSTVINYFSCSLLLIFMVCICVFQRKNSTVDIIFSNT